MKSKLYFSTVFIIALLIMDAKVKDEPVYLPRGNYNAKLEIKDKIIHGAGQGDPAEFLNYFNAMSDNTKPVIYMDYINLKYNSDIEVFIKKLKDLLVFYENKNIYIVPQIGFEMTVNGNPSKHFEDEVADGKFDVWLDKFCKLFKDLSHPAFIRIGYEFNGSWNGYNPVTYKKAFQRMTQKFREHNLDIATAWCAAPPLGNYMPYYPGDEYVDWWSINLFGESDILSKDVKDFIDNAKKHNKPVIIGESTPMNIGALKGKESWDRWYKKYFELIKENKNLKAFSYINCDWTNTMWKTWGDSRIEKNDYVKSKYIEELSNPIYLNGTDEKNYKKLLGVADDNPPSQVLNLNAVFDNSQINLSWDKSKDDSNNLRYLIYADGSIKDYTVNNYYNDNDLKAGETLSYSVQAADYAGNRSILSKQVKITVPLSLNKIFNGDFENGKTNWTTMVFQGGELKFDIDSANPVSGKNSARIEAVNNTGTNWNVQFAQKFKSYKGMKYDLSFKIRSSRDISFDLFIQQDHSPYSCPFAKKINAKKDIATYEFKNIDLLQDDSVYLTFMVGNVNKGTIFWIDDVVLIEKK